MEEDILSAPEILIAASSLSSLPTSVEIPVILIIEGVPTEVARYRVELVSPMPDAFGDILPSDTWCYEVTELSGRNLSHWVLAIECFVTPDNHIIGSSPSGTIGQDGSTGYWGIKWNAPFPGDTFCITLDATYSVTMIQVVVKTGNGGGVGDGVGIGYIAGPDCWIIQHNGVEQGTVGTP